MRRPISNSCSAASRPATQKALEAIYRLTAPVLLGVVMRIVQRREIAAGHRPGNLSDLVGAPDRI